LKSLVIVESPAKAKTINKILGSDFSVKASIGHVKDLPKKKLGVDVEKNFEPNYEIIPGKEKIIKELKDAARNADKIYLATDPDREGEAIAYHIAEEIREDKKQKAEVSKKKIYRITFHEITERAVKEAIKNPGDIDINKVEAQQARRILDRLVGYNLSPFLWKKVRRGLSAGRVQSVAVRLIVDREREIESFKKREYWTIEALLQPSDLSLQPFWSRLYKYKGSLVINRDAEEDKQFLITDSETANKIANEIRDKDFYVEKIDRRLKKKSPPPPFITSTIQQEAARRLKFPAKKTMMIAQQLYEGIDLGKEGSVGLITYMRTDSFKVSEDAQKWARQLIAEQFGKDYVPEHPPKYKSKKGAQEAHEAIRPTYPDKTPEYVKPFLSKDQYNLYTLIWNRFLASQMSPAQLELTTYIIGIRTLGKEMEGTEFRSSGTVIKFPGFMALYSEGKDEIEDEEGQILPTVKEKDSLKQIDLKLQQHFTQPPPRYTEATLIKALEEKGIGRPSTYATILSTIQERKYVEKNEDKRFYPTELGIIVNDLLVEKFPELIDIDFTSKMENELDAIENKKLRWLKVVKDFYKPFSHDLAEALKDLKRVKLKDVPTDEMCEKCGSHMVIKWGRHGRFLACSNYPECKNTRPIPTGVTCPIDGGDIVEKRSKKGKKFWSCSNYPKCNFALWYKPVPKTCPKCGASFLVEKWSKDKIILSCLTKGCDYREEIEVERSSEA
jgi:DNA topoisomerase-1